MTLGVVTFELNQATQVIILQFTVSFLDYKKYLFTIGYYFRCLQATPPLHIHSSTPR